MKQVYLKNESKKLVKGYKNADVIGNNIRILRELLGVSQNDLADALLIARSLVAMWEAGLFITPFVVEVVAKCFNVRESFLLEDIHRIIQKSIEPRLDSKEKPLVFMKEGVSYKPHLTKARQARRERKIKNFEFPEENFCGEEEEEEKYDFRDDT